MTTRRIPLRDLVARGPVLSRRARAALLAADGPSGVAYAGPPRLPFPVMPLQIFGIRYDLDLVLVDDSPSWDMHEYARIDGDGGPVWLCKDTIDGTLEQTIVADLDDLDHLVPEVPLRRRRAKVEVTDRGDGKRLDLVLDYTNLEDRAVRVTYRGPRPKPVRLRNSSTMKHSRDQLIAVLDLSAKALATEASIAYDGAPAQLYRILGVAPFAVAIVQTQAGFSIGRFVQRDAGTEHASGALQAWSTEVDGDEVALVQAGRLRTLRYVFRAVGDALELTRAEALPEGGGAPVCTVRFVPSLPDLRRPFEGPWEGRYVVDVGGGPGHAVGRIRIAHDRGAARIDVLPDAPRWTTDRPLTSTVRLGEGRADVEIVRAG